MIFNMIGSNGPSLKSTIIVSVSTGSTVEVYTDAACTTLVKTAIEKSSGEFWITGLNNGIYYIKATKNVEEAIIPYTINEFGVYRITIVYRVVPAFTYSGNYTVVDDNGTIISNLDTYQGNWKIRFLDSGTLNFSNLYSARNGIDVFLVGGGGAGSNPSGGGAGGGGGYTRTFSSVTVSTGSPYSVTVGEGGDRGSKGVATGANGGASSFGELEPANGGYGGQGTTGGNGGSGGGSGYTASQLSDGETKLAGGSDGGNGSANISTQDVGIGQGTTTREFGESSGKLYAGGGGGGSNQGSSAPSYGGAGGAGGGGHGFGTSSKPATAGETNTGGGGGAGANNTVNNTSAALLAGSGGSGIVIIRNARS